MDAQKMEGLAGIVDEADGAAGPTPEQAQQQQQIDDTEQQAREWGMLAYMIGGALAMVAPEVKQIYTDDACLAWGRSVVPVAEKYGFTGPSKVPELGLLLATASLAVPTVLVIRHRLKTLQPDDAGKPGPTGILASIKQWWRDKRAKRTAAVVKEATDAAAEAVQQTSGAGRGG
jgi:hypothetical protein